MATAEQYLRVPGGHPQDFPPGERFSYCNGGFVVLAQIAERTAGAPFAELLRELVRPGGHGADGISPVGRAARRRGDELPGSGPSS